MKSVGWLQTLCSDEVLGIELCWQCHRNANRHENTWITTPHKKPHLLIWAKFAKHPIWPALFLKAHANEKKAYVRFFGDTSYASVPIENCFLFSTKQSNAVKSTKVDIQKLMEKGLQVR